MQPAIMQMFSTTPQDYKTTRPNWGPCSVWRYWNWRELHASGGFEMARAYVRQCNAYGYRPAISCMLYHDWGKDATPDYVYGQYCQPQTATNAAGQTIQFPGWNQAYWRDEFDQFLLRFGAEVERWAVDPDPAKRAEVDSVWICSGLYGENLTGSSKTWNIGNGFWAWVPRALNTYKQAFPTIPVWFIGGTQNRAVNAQLAADLGFSYKMNALMPDQTNAEMHKSNAGNGVAEVALLLMERGVPIGYEHFFFDNDVQTYWAMLTGLAFGMQVFDTDAKHLEVLARLEMPNESMWDWVLRMMDPANGALWVARDTQYPPKPDSWDDSGWVGPYERGVRLVSGPCEYGAAGSALLKAAPDALKTYISAYGIGRFDGTLELRAEWSAPYVKVCALVAGNVTLQYGIREVSPAVKDTSGGWEYLEFSGTWHDTIRLLGSGYVHMVWLERAEQPPEPPVIEPPEPPVTVSDFEKRLAALEAESAEWRELIKRIRAALA